jgi:hypothetical protein
VDIEIDRVPGRFSIEFDHVCWTCNDEPQKFGRRGCPDCKGVGWTLTDEGEELATFIERHFNVTRKAI